MPNDALAEVETTHAKVAKKHHLLVAVRKLIYRLDLFKVTINSLDTSCFAPSNKDLAQVQHEYIYKSCRKKLHLVINLMETLCETLEKKICYVNVSRAIDSVYWALKSVKEHLLKLADSKLTDVVKEVQSMIENANGDIRSLGLDLIKPSVENTLITLFREIKTDVDAEVIDIISDSDDEKKSSNSTRKAAKSAKVKCGSRDKKRKLSCDECSKAESSNKNNKSARKNDELAQTKNSVRVTRRKMYNN